MVMCCWYLIYFRLDDNTERLVVFSIGFAFWCIFRPFKIVLVLLWSQSVLPFFVLAFKALLRVKKVEMEAADGPYNRKPL